MLQVRDWKVRTFVCALAMGAISPVLAAQERTELPRGFHLSGALAVGRPALSSRAEQALVGPGGTGTSSGMTLGLGWSARRIRSSLELDVGSLAVRGEQAGTLAVTVLVQARLPGQLRGWMPHATIGYVRQGISDVTVQAAELPADLRDGANGAAVIEDFSTIGNGARFGLGVARPVARRFVVTIDGSVDAMRYSSVMYDGFERSFANAGWSWLPRLAVGGRRYIWR